MTTTTTMPKYATESLVHDFIFDQVCYGYLKDVALHNDQFGWTDWVNEHCGKELASLLKQVKRGNVEACLRACVGLTNNLARFLQDENDCDRLKFNEVRIPLQPLKIIIGGQRAINDYAATPEDFELLHDPRVRLINAKQYVYKGSKPYLAVPLELEAVATFIEP